jgi:putative multicomponent Na+:H+ antiporter subunit B
MYWHTVPVAEVAMADSYIYVIIALLPLAASMLVLQVNPYHALVIRGILGAMAALVYEVLGAPDVALTEALVGTMLAITLYAIAVRSSLVMRLGVIKDESIKADDDCLFGQLMNELRTIFGKRHMRLELVTYTNTQALHRALMDKEVHAICAPSEYSDEYGDVPGDEKQPYQTATRVQRIYEIIQSELSSPGTTLTYVSTPDSGKKHP